MAEIGGPGFDDIAAAAVPARNLPAYLPRIRYRRGLRGQLTEPIYSISIEDALTRRGIRSVDEIRDFVGLDEHQGLVLLMFGRDRVLERVWSERDTLPGEIAQAGYLDVVAPSYSTWSPRPRTEFLYMAKRSLVMFALLQNAGARAIPRLAWEIPHDVKRWARWLQSNPSVEQVALDLATYRKKSDFSAQLKGLALLDELTERRLSYVINGVSTYPRIMQLYDAVSPRRVSLTNARAIARPAEGQERTFSEKCATERQLIGRARASTSGSTLQAERRATVQTMPKSHVPMTTGGIPLAPLRRLASPTKSSRPQA
jgi:hypothetical protein